MSLAGESLSLRTVDDVDTWDKGGWRSSAVVGGSGLGWCGSCDGVVEVGVDGLGCCGPCFHRRLMLVMMFRR